MCREGSDTQYATTLSQPNCRNLDLWEVSSRGHCCASQDRLQKQREMIEVSAFLLGKEA